MGLRAQQWCWGGHDDSLGKVFGVEAFTIKYATHVWGDEVGTYEPCSWGIVLDMWFQGETSYVS